MRLFLGTMLSLEQQTQIGEVQQAVSSGDAQGHSLMTQARPIASNKLHMTWLFLGEVDESKLEPITNKLDILLSGVSGEKLASYRLPEILQFDQAVIWPKPGKPEFPGYIVLTVGDQKLLEPIISLGNSLRLELSQYIEKNETSEFRPHITLWRFKNGLNAELESMQVLEAFCQAKVLPVSLRLDKLSVVQSHTGEGHNHYEVVVSFPLY